MRVEDALRVGGGARGVDEEPDRARIGGRRSGRGPGDLGVCERAVHRLVAHHDHVLEGGQRGPQLPHQRAVVAVPVAAGDEEDAGPGLGQDEAELPPAVDGQDGVRDRAQTRRGEEHGQRLGPVRELEGDHVAGADAARREAAREPLGRGGERGEAGARGPLDHDGPGAGPGGRGGEGRPERLSAPQAGLAVAIHERRKMGRNGGAQAVLTIPILPHMGERSRAGRARR